MAVAGAEHGRFGGAIGGGGRRLGLCARALDAGHSRAAQGHSASRRPWRATLRLGLLFRVSEELLDAAQSGAISRVAAGRGPRFSGTPGAGRALGTWDSVTTQCSRQGLDLENEIDALMRAYQGSVPGACVAVLHDGAPIVRRAYGLAVVENRAAATTATNYRLASITKQFTAAAILLLAEDGRLSIGDSIRKWLPMPDAADDMLVRHLLTHTSGVIDFEDLIPEGTTAQVHDADVLRLLQAENRGYFTPGARYRYSNSGYVLLALIVGRASGEDFASFLRNRIFLPLGMRTTVAFEEGVSIVAHRAF